MLQEKVPYAIHFEYLGFPFFFCTCTCWDSAHNLATNHTNSSNESTELEMFSAMFVDYTDFRTAHTLLRPSTRPEEALQMLRKHHTFAW